MAPRPARLVCHVTGHINIFKDIVSTMICHRNLENRALQMPTLAVLSLHRVPVERESYLQIFLVSVSRLDLEECFLLQLHKSRLTPVVSGRWLPSP